MSKDPSIYDLLAKQNISELTVENLDKAPKYSSIDPTNLEFWSGVITVSRAMEHSRTFPHGLPIPDSQAIEVLTVADGATGPIKPTGDNEIWRVENIDLDNCVCGFFDGTSFSALPVSAPYNSPPFYITASVYLAFNNGSGSEQTPSIVYSKVAL